MSKLLANNYRYRRTFQKFESVVNIGNLIEIQRRSYDLFLQPQADAPERRSDGCRACFRAFSRLMTFLVGRRCSS